MTNIGEFFIFLNTIHMSLVIIYILVFTHATLILSFVHSLQRQLWRLKRYIYKLVVDIML